MNEKWVKLINSIRQDVTLKQEFLQARLQAENEAKALLLNKGGNFSENDMVKFLNLCNTEIVPLNDYSIKLRNYKTCTRFQLSFIGQNRKLMIKSLDLCNYWILRLWKTKNDPLSDLSEFWEKKPVPGSGVGLPTMILYLKDPTEYNIWLPFLNDACNLFAGHKLSSKRNIENYLLYNNTVINELRKPFNLEPQEIDYILYRLEKSDISNKKNGNTNKTIEKNIKNNNR